MSLRSRIGTAGLAITLCALTAATASAPGATTACSVPAGEQLLARHNHVVVWEDPTVPGGDFGSIYACSASHRIAVPVVTVYNPPCPSPTGCTDWNSWNYTAAKIAGPWVVASAAFTDSPDRIGLWDSRGNHEPRRVAALAGGPAEIDSYTLALRADGALAFAYQGINKFRYFDALDGCGTGCHRVRRLDKLLEPASSTGRRRLLTDVHFGRDKYLFWRDAGQPRTARLQ